MLSSVLLGTILAVVFKPRTWCVVCPIKTLRTRYIKMTNIKKEEKVDKRFDPKKLNKLNNPARLIDMPPEYIWEKLNLKNPDKIIDIGAGTGFFSIQFLNLIKNGVVYAADISEVMIQWLEENITDQHNGIVPILIKDSTIPLDDSIADLVIMINLHHELDKPELNVTESFRLLKEGGKICIIDWKKEEMDFGPPLKIRSSTEDVSNQLRVSGFKNIQIDNTLTKHFFIMGEK